MMSGERLIEIILFLVLAMFVSCFACIPIPTSTPMILMAEASPAPPQPCSMDFNCPPGMFCRETQTCINCTICQEYNRLPVNNKECVRGKGECGGCIPGYKEVEGVCTKFQPQKGSEEIKTENKKTQPIKDGGVKSEPIKLELIIPLAILTVVSCAGAFFGIGICYRTIVQKRNQRALSRVRNTSGSGENGNPEHGDFGSVPSAPLLPLMEYQTPSPYNSTVSKTQPFTNLRFKDIFHPLEHNPSARYVVASSSNQQALPFNAGNGYGDWLNDAVAGNNNDQQIQPVNVDADDGNAVPAPVINEVAQPNQVQPDGIQEQENFPGGELVEINVDDIIGNQILPGVDENEEMDLGEIAGTGQPDEMYANPEDFIFHFDFSFQFGFEPNNSRRRRHSEAFDPEETCFDLGPWISHASSSTSMSVDASTDSGTGTSNEHEDEPASPRSVVPPATVPQVATAVPDIDLEETMYEEDQGPYDEWEDDIEVE